MFHFDQYTEVYSTLKMEDFFSAKNILSEHGIRFKDSTIDNQKRFLFNLGRGGGSPLMSRDGWVKPYYRLSVKKEEVQTASHFLHDGGL